MLVQLVRLGEGQAKLLEWYELVQVVVVEVLHLLCLRV